MAKRRRLSLPDVGKRLDAVVVDVGERLDAVVVQLDLLERAIAAHWEQLRQLETRVHDLANPLLVLTMEGHHLKDAVKALEHRIAALEPPGPG